MLAPLTERQRSILITIIQRELSGEGYYSVKELADLYGMRSANAMQEHVSALRKKGYLDHHQKGKSRAIVVSRTFMLQAAHRGIALISPETLRAATIEDLIGLRIQLEDECRNRDFNLRGLPIRRTPQFKGVVHRKEVEFLPQASSPYHTQTLTENEELASLQSKEALGSIGISEASIVDVSHL